MAETNIRLLASKIAALDPEAQHAVEIAVDSLLVDAGLGPKDPRRTEPRDEIVFLDEHNCHQPDLVFAIERLMNAAQRTLDELHRADAAYA